MACKRSAWSRAKDTESSSKDSTYRAALFAREAEMTFELNIMGQIRAKAGGAKGKRCERR